MAIIGITGSIASGKSVVAQLFVDCGAHLIDWDVIGHEVMLPQRKAWQGVVQCFGRDILNDDQTIDRQKLGKMVFDDPEKLQQLNRIVHPEIINEDKRRADEISKKYPDAVIIKEVPLLTAEIKDMFVEKAVVVCVSEESQIKRLIERGFSREDAIKRIQAHVSTEEKLKFADYVIYNDWSLDETKKQVEKIYDQMKSDR